MIAVDIQFLILCLLKVQKVKRSIVEGGGGEAKTVSHYLGHFSLRKQLRWINDKIKFQKLGNNDKITITVNIWKIPQSINFCIERVRIRLADVKFRENGNGQTYMWKLKKKKKEPIVFTARIFKIFSGLIRRNSCPALLSEAEPKSRSGGVVITNNRPVIVIAVIDKMQPRL